MTLWKPRSSVNNTLERCVTPFGGNDGCISVQDNGEGAEGVACCGLGPGVHAGQGER